MEAARPHPTPFQRAFKECQSNPSVLLLKGGIDRSEALSLKEQIELAHIMRHSDDCDCPECLAKELGLRPACSSHVHPLETNEQFEDNKNLTGADTTPGTAIQAPRCEHAGSFESYAARLIQPAELDETILRHHHWQERRFQVWQAMNRLGMNSRKLEQFAHCGAAMWLEFSAAGDDLRLRCNCCKNRWCEPCMEKRSFILRDNIKKLVQGKTVRFITLTLRHSQTPLKDQIDRLFRSFAELRRRKEWLAHVTGGAAFLECKISSKDGLWHPHLHIIGDGCWWDQRELSKEWHAVTGDSTITDIRQVTDVEVVGSYVTKYVTKPAHSSVFAQDKHLDEMMHTLQGRRLCTTFGSWRGKKLEAVTKSDAVWKPVGSVHNLLRAAAAGDATARAHIQAAARKYPHMPWPPWALPDGRPKPDSS